MGMSDVLAGDADEEEEEGDDKAVGFFVLEDIVFMDDEVVLSTRDGISNCIALRVCGVSSKVDEDEEDEEVG